MSELKNFPFKNQLDEPNLDHIPDINAGMNCLPTDIAAGLQYLTGKQYTGEEIEHAVYGANYRGGTSAVEYVEYCAKQGVRIFPVSGSPAYLVSQVHSHLAQGHPVIGTIPSTYMPPADRMNPGESHCIVFYKDSAGVLIAMNPWKAIAQAQPDQWWMDRFCFEQVWIMEKQVDNSIHVPLGWKDDGKTLLAPNGKKVVQGFRSWVLAHDFHPDDWPLEEEHGAAGGGTEQLFCREMLNWNQKRGVYETYLGVDLQVNVSLVDKYHAQLTQALADQKALQDEVDALKAQPAPAPNPDLGKALTSIADSIQNIIDAL